MTGPSARQHHLLERVRELLTTQFNTTEIASREHWRHYEDEELGFPSLGTSAGFHLLDLAFPIDVSTPFPWESNPANHIKAVFPDYRDGRGGSDPWALLIDARTRRRYRRLGFEDQCGYYRATWPVNVQPKSIVQAIEGLVAIPVQILRPQDLPPDAKWPWHGLVQLMAASRRTKLVPRGDGETFSANFKSGMRRSVILSKADAAFLRHWWRRH